MLDIRVVNMEVIGPFSENRFGDQLGQELKCGRWRGKGKKVGTIKVGLVMKSGDVCNPPPKTGAPNVCGAQPFGCRSRGWLVGWAPRWFFLGNSYECFVARRLARSVL